MRIVLYYFFSYHDEQPVFKVFNYGYMDEPLELPDSWVSRSPFRVLNLDQVEIPPDEKGFHGTRDECLNGFAPLIAVVDGESFFYQPILFERKEPAIYADRTIEDMEEEVDQPIEIVTEGFLYDDLGIFPSKASLSTIDRTSRGC